MAVRSLLLACLLAFSSLVVAPTASHATTVPISAADCLARSAENKTDLNGELTGSQGTAATQADRTWDLRDFSQTANPSPTRYPFRLDSAKRACVIGGSVVGNIPRDWPREKWYHGTDTTAEWDGEGYRLSQTADSPWTYQYGSYVENVSDGFDPNGLANGVNHDYLDRVHAKYVRDDCIEVEGEGYSPHSLTVNDSLFDGCFNFLSMRPTGTSHADAGTTEGTLTIDNSLVYVQPQPLSANDCATHPERCVDGKGNHAFFKWSSSAVKDVVVRNTVLRMDQPATASTRAMNFPQGTYENVTLVWTWPEPYTSFASLPPGVTVTKDVGVWDRAKAAWLARTISTDPAAPPAPTNLAPVALAGPDLSVPAGSGLQLRGSVSDDGLPAGSTVSARWESVSGPAAPTLVDPNSASTSASFSTSGTYVLRLTASDGQLSSRDDVTVIVPKAAASVSVQRRVAASTDDSEQARYNGRQDLTSSDLELGYDGQKQQIVGLRFQNVTIPHGAKVTRAYVQFTSRAAGTTSSAVTLRAQASDDAATFRTTTNDVASRPVTAAAASWSPVTWPGAGLSGTDQRTPDLSAVVQQVVDRSGWRSGSSLAMLVDSSRGTRNAWSFDGAASKAPLLVLEYTPPAT